MTPTEVAVTAVMVSLGIIASIFTIVADPMHYRWEKFQKRREPQPDVCIEIDMDPKDMKRAVKAGLFEKQTVYRLTKKGKDSLIGYMK